MGAPGDELGETPLFEAAACGSVEVVAALLVHRADPEQRLGPKEGGVTGGQEPKRGWFLLPLSKQWKGSWHLQRPSSIRIPSTRCHPLSCLMRGRVIIGVLKSQSSRLEMKNGKGGSRPDYCT